jgi:RNA-directed DNA polymerase
MRRPRAKSLTKFKDTIRDRTKRNNGHSLEQIISDVNIVIRGWFEYFKHSNRTTFRELDGWIRMRLRSILRRRQRRKGRARGTDHQRWPNIFFVERGLFSMTEAHCNVSH